MLLLRGRRHGEAEADTAHGQDLMIANGRWSCRITTVRGICIAGPRHRPRMVINSRHVANADAGGRRFTLAQALCRLLFDREAGRRLAIASGPWAPRDVERRADAFAAMLLMPVSLVQRAVSRLPLPLATREGVTMVSERLQVGRSWVPGHLKNLGFLDETSRQGVEDEMSLAV